MLHPERSYHVVIFEPDENTKLLLVDASYQNKQLLVIVDGLNPVGLDAILYCKRQLCKQTETQVKEVHFYMGDPQEDLLEAPISTPYIPLSSEPEELQVASYTRLSLLDHNLTAQGMSLLMD